MNTNTNTITIKGKKGTIVSGNGRAIELAKIAVENKGSFIRPCYDTSKVSGFNSIVNYTNEVIDILNQLGLKFGFFNDAPKGGRTGNWIVVN